MARDSFFIGTKVTEKVGREKSLLTYPHFPFSNFVLFGGKIQNMIGIKWHDSIIHFTKGRLSHYNERNRETDQKLCSLVACHCQF